MELPRNSFVGFFLLSFSFSGTQCVASSAAMYGLSERLEGAG